MTGNAQLDGILFIFIGIGAALATFVGVLAAMVFYVKPRMDSFFKSTKATAEAVKTDAKAESKKTAEEVFADLGKRRFDEIEQRNQIADQRYSELQARFDVMEATAAKRAADDQRRISDLERQIQTLTTQVRTLETERGAIMRERDLALQKAEELEREVGRLRKDSEKSADTLRKLEIELAGLKAGNAVLQGIFDKIQWLGAANNSTPASPPSESS